MAPPQLGGELVVAAGGDPRSASGPGRRDPEQSAAVVGERDDEQAMAFAPAGVVLPVLFAGAPPGADQRAVQQHHPATLVGDLVVEGPVEEQLERGVVVLEFPHLRPGGRARVGRLQRQTDDGDKAPAREALEGLRWLLQEDRHLQGEQVLLQVVGETLALGRHLPGERAVVVEPGEPEGETVEEPGPLPGHAVDLGWIPRGRRRPRRRRTGWPGRGRCAVRRCSLRRTATRSARSPRGTGTRPPPTRRRCRADRGCGAARWCRAACAERGGGRTTAPGRRARSPRASSRRTRCRGDRSRPDAVPGGGRRSRCAAAARRSSRTAPAHPAPSRCTGRRTRRAHGRGRRP